MAQKNQLKRNQSGLVSIMVTMVMMVVLSLIVLAFARNARREQRQALDSQLSTQAFYAAESGVNDALKAIEDGTITLPKSNCDQLPETSFSDNTVSNPCILIEDNPNNLRFDSVQQNSSIDFIIDTTADGRTVRDIYFYWQGNINRSLANCPPNVPPNLPSVASWGSCQHGGLRIDIVPLNDTFDREELAQRAYTVFTFPVGSSPTNNGLTTYARNNGNNLIVPGSCSNSQPNAYCLLGVGNFVERDGFSPLNTFRYYVRIRALYRDAEQIVVVAKSNSEPQLKLGGVQYVIDSTGKANDVLRRISVRVPVESGDETTDPAWALASADTLCKRLSILPGLAPTTDLDPACRLD